MGQEMLTRSETPFHSLWGVHNVTNSLYMYIRYILLNLSVNGLYVY